MISPAPSRNPSAPAPARTARIGRGRALALVGAVTVGMAVLAGATMELTHGEGGVGVAAAVMRFLRYATTLLAAGAFAFLAAVRPRDVSIDRTSQRVTALVAAAGAGFALLSVPVQSAYLGGRVGAALDPPALRFALDSGFGVSVLLGATGLALCALAATRLPARAAVGIGAAGAVLAIGGFLLTGHSVTSEPRTLALTSNFVHLAAGSVWLGGLVLLPLTLADRRRRSDAPGGARTVSRFSNAAGAMLVLVAVAGAALAWVEVRALSALTTAYGGILLAKTGLVAGVVAVAAYNNRRLVPAISHGDEHAGQRLSRLVRLEAAGLVAVLAVTAVLVNTMPARTEAGIGGQVTASAPLGPDHDALAIVEPAVPGSNEVHLYLLDDTGQPDGDTADMELSFVPPATTEASATATPWNAGPGHWLHGGEEFDEVGLWTLEVHATVDGRPETAEIPLPLGPDRAMP